MKTLEEILPIAYDLFLKRGFKNVHMDDLAEEVGVSKKTLYVIVPSKAFLIDAVIENHIRLEKTAMLAITAQHHNALDQMRAISEYVILMFQQVPAQALWELKTYYRKTWLKIQALHGKQIYDIIHTNLLLGQEQGLYKSDLNPDIISKLYLVKAMSLIDEEIFPHRHYSRRELIQNHLSYHLAGILSEDGVQKFKLISQ
jgi:AcrR family transcriptional regulator